jgi:hypothetical protein
MSEAQEVATMTHETGQRQSSLSQHAQLVAQAWLDPAFKARLLANPAIALREQGIAVPASAEVRVVEDTDRIVYVHLPAQPTTETFTLEQLGEVVGGSLWVKIPESLT